MIFYDFKCDKCNIIWEKDYPGLSKTPRRKLKCPKCKRWALRYYCADNVPAVKIPGTKHKVVRSDVQKIYDEALADSKERLSKSYQMKHTPYKSYVPDIPKMVKDGLAKPCSPERLTQKFERAKKMTASAYEHAKVDLKKSARRTNDN